MTYHYLLALLGMAVQGLFIKAEHDQKPVLAVTLKGIASLIFVCLGFMISTFTKDAHVATYVKLGLIFGMLGDILLNLRYVFTKKGNLIFLVGILIFMIGHIFYFVAILPMCTNKLVAIGVGVVLTFFLLKWIFSQIEAKMAFKIFGVFYLGAITIMNCVACANMITLHNTFTIALFIGALLFLLSDIVLILNTFGKESKFALRITNLSLYYVGQLVIAFSLMWG